MWRLYAVLIGYDYCGVENRIIFLLDSFITFSDAV